jgi:hypothetical protein
MAILSSRQAKQLGRLGGKVSAADRKGDREWGRKAQRQRAAKVQKQRWPELSRIWIENARRTRWGLPLIPVSPVDTPAANRMRAPVWRESQVEVQGGGRTTDTAESLD